MGKGKNGCDGSSLTPLSSILEAEPLELQQMVEAGEGREALTFLLDSVTPYQAWIEWLSGLIDSEQKPMERSIYRHMLAALLFEKGIAHGDDQLIFRARRPLLDDTLDLDTSEEYRRMAENKLRELRSRFGYFERVNPSERHSSDALRLQTSRDMQRPVLLVTRDEEQEIEALRRAYGADLVVFPDKPSDKPADYQLMINTFLVAARDDKVFVVRSSALLDQKSVEYLEEAAGRQHLRNGRFGFVWLVTSGSPHLQGRAAGACQVLDFSAWRERGPKPSS